MNTEAQLTFSLVSFCSSTEPVNPGPVPCCLGLVPVLLQKWLGVGHTSIDSQWSITLDSPPLGRSNQKLLSGTFLSLLVPFFTWAGLGLVVAWDYISMTCLEGAHGYLWSTCTGSAVSVTPMSCLEPPTHPGIRKSPDSLFCFRSAFGHGSFQWPSMQKSLEMCFNMVVCICVICKVSLLIFFILGRKIIGLWL